MPFYNYMGPGTHVFDRIERGDLPVTLADKVAMLHDVNYVIANGDPMLLKKADDIALSSLPLSDPLYWVMRVGLKTRQNLHLYEGKIDVEKADKVKYLKMILENRQDFRPYGITSNDFVA